MIMLMGRLRRISSFCPFETAEYAVPPPPLCSILAAPLIPADIPLTVWSVQSLGDRNWHISSKKEMLH